MEDPIKEIAKYFGATVFAKSVCLYLVPTTLGMDWGDEKDFQFVFFSLISFTVCNLIIQFLFSPKYKGPQNVRVFKSMGR